MRPAALSILGLVLLVPVALSEQPAEPRPRFDIDAAFTRRVDAICKDAKPEAESLARLTTAQEREGYVAAFAVGLQKRQIVARGGYCGTVRPEDRPSLYGVIAGDDAAAKAQTKAYQEIRDALRDRKDKPRIEGGASLLHMAVRENDEKGLRLLLEAGIEPDLRGEIGVTALSEAIRHGRLPLVKTLLERRASVYQATTIYKDAPLVAAVRAPKDRVFELVELLLSRGADPERLSLIGIDDPRLLAMLIKSGADVTAPNGDGYTALHFAASEEIARLLVDAGADVNSVSADEFTPLDNVKDEQVIRFLRARGATSSQKCMVRSFAYGRLDERPPVDFNENKLINILDYYRNCTGLSMCIDWRALEAAGIRKDALITLSLHDTSAQDSLRLVLGKVSVKVVFEVDAAGTVVIGTLESVRRIASRMEAARDFIDPKAGAKRLAVMTRMSESLDSFDIEEDLEDGSLNTEEAITYLASKSGRPPRVDWPALKRASLDSKHRVELGIGRRPSPYLALNYLLAQSGAVSWAIGISEAGEVVISTEKEFDTFMKAVNSGK